MTRSVHWMNAGSLPQRIAIAIGLGLITLLSLFPPWKLSESRVVGPERIRPKMITSRYALLSPPRWKAAYGTIRTSVIGTERQNLLPDYDRLRIEWTIVAAVTAAAVILLPRRLSQEQACNEGEASDEASVGL